MSDYFEKSISSINSANLGNYDFYTEDTNQESQISDISIFALDKGSYDVTLNAINNFLRKDPTFDNVAEERDKIIKELYGSLENYQEEENFFLINNEF